MLSKMTNLQKKRLVAFVAIILAALVFQITMYLSDNYEDSYIINQCTEQTVAVINVFDPSQFSIQYYFRYEVDGKEYGGFEALNRHASDSSAKPDGTIVNILYKKDNPKVFVVAEEDAKELFTTTTSFKGRIFLSQIGMFVLFVIVDIKFVKQIKE